MLLNYIGLPQTFFKFKFSMYIFENPSNKNFHEKLSSGSRFPKQQLYYITCLALVLQSVQKETMNMNRHENRQNGETYITKLRIAFSCFAKGPKSWLIQLNY